jgi:hypothetical protein
MKIGDTIEVVTNVHEPEIKKGVVGVIRKIGNSYYSVKLQNRYRLFWFSFNEIIKKENK